MQVQNNTLSGRIPSSLFNISRLRRLDMSFNSLGGNVPEEIGNLRCLEVAYFWRNELRGNVPNAIFNMSSLVEIDLGVNRLSGKIPHNLCQNTPKLEMLNLQRNQLFGEISPAVEMCGELTELDFSANYFTGYIPIEIGNLTKLMYLYLMENEFKGGLPKEFSKLVDLRVLNMGNSSLSGAIPPAIFNISTLQYLELSFNNFSGSLPSSMGVSLFNLKALTLQINSLSGQIPSSINNASQLNELDLSYNSLSGSIPNFANLPHLTEFSIQGNNLSSTPELSFLSSLTNSQQLRFIRVFDNPLNGVLPTSVGNLSHSLEYFRAFGTGLRGVIPFEIGNLINLIDLDLSGNQLSGSIPSTIGKLKKLGRLKLENNQLQGSIPVNLCQMSSLAELTLAYNVLEGPIPECWGEIQSLRVMDFSSNTLNSTIPSNFWNLRDLIFLNLSTNYLSGQISSQIGNLKMINQIDLSSNLLSGDIPSSIDGCQSLDYLSLSNNNFGGSIPQSFGNMKGLTTLDLSNNNFSGLIPKSLENLKFLAYFNVSYNRLEGKIPNEGVFANFTPRSFVHNVALCGAPRFELQRCPDVDGGTRSKNIGGILMKYILPSLVATMVLVIFIFFLIRRSKSIQVPNPVDTSLGSAWRLTSYIELSRATNNFSETSLLGRGSFGSVFKGTFSDGLNIAAKVFKLELEGASKCFEIESRILSTIRHRNLVGIIGCCTNMEFKALILEFMPNGSLEKWLYSESYCLSILQLLDISIDVGLALEYLHHGNAFPIVHCDIKPSNVLLDQDMTARVADFGIAKLFEEGETMIQTSTLATIGYAAPEYGSEGKVSTSADVYSYGILLLEMLTRKRPTDDMFNEEMSLKEWVSEALKANAMNQVLAPALLSEEDRNFVAKAECAASVFDLAMKCLGTSPYERINMKEGAATLKKIKAKVEKSVAGKRQQRVIRHLMSSF